MPSSSGANDLSASWFNDLAASPSNRGVLCSWGRQVRASRQSYAQALSLRLDAAKREVPKNGSCRRWCPASIPTGRSKQPCYGLPPARKRYCSNNFAIGHEEFFAVCARRWGPMAPWPSWRSTSSKSSSSVQRRIARTTFWKRSRWRYASRTHHFGWPSRSAPTSTTARLGTRALHRSSRPARSRSHPSHPTSLSGSSSSQPHEWGSPLSRASSRTSLQKWSASQQRYRSCSTRSANSSIGEITRPSPARLTTSLVALRELWLLGPRPSMPAPMPKSGRRSGPSLAE